ncbi:MAG: vanadium-dependent haloperoxidase [Planctomycetota bacterium]
MNLNRVEQALEVRQSAARLAAGRGRVKHQNNGEEYRYRNGRGTASLLAAFTKGLAHDPRTGLLVNPVGFELFVTGIQSSSPIDFRRTPLGPDREAGSDPDLRVPDSPSPCLIDAATLDRRPFWYSNIAKNPTNRPEFATTGEAGVRVRAWESAGAGNVFDLQGPDAQAVTMPPAPTLDSDELVAEVAEVYCMALLRELPFSDFPLPEESGAAKQADRHTVDHPDCDVDPGLLEACFEMLAELPWFRGWDEERGYDDAEISRRRLLNHSSDMFRGVTPGEREGPYLSQFFLSGNRGLGNVREVTDGRIAYGSIEIDHRVRVATPARDFMTTWKAYLDVQNGADVRGEESYVDADHRSLPALRFIATPRDLATYVHYDALYEAYLNACIFLLSSGAPFDPGIPFLRADATDHQQGFAHFGGPHILTLVCEVATRALKAVRYQKFNIHRRLRPEAVGGRVDRWLNDVDLQSGVLRPLGTLMGGDGDETSVGLSDMVLGDQDFLEVIRQHNERNNKRPEQKNEPDRRDASYLLPMAFPEGSPMHPSYGAGHGTVAGACVTILKAYFDHGWTPPEWFIQTPDGRAPVAYYPTRDGRELKTITLDSPLTIEGELNKLAANVAIGRNWAGVHYYSDYIESLRLGEQIAIEMLEEQKLTYPENFSMTIPLFDGGACRV